MRRPVLVVLLLVVLLVGTGIGYYTGAISRPTDDAAEPDLGEWHSRVDQMVVRIIEADPEHDGDIVRYKTVVDARNYPPYPIRREGMPVDHSASGCEARNGSLRVELECADRLPPQETEISRNSSGSRMDLGGITVEAGQKTTTSIVTTGSLGSTWLLRESPAGSASPTVAIYDINGYQAIVEGELSDPAVRDEVIAVCVRASVNSMGEYEAGRREAEAEERKNAGTLSP